MKSEDPANQPVPDQKDDASSDPLKLVDRQAGVIVIRLAKDENGELRATGDPSSIEAIKNLFSWLPGGGE